jgi:hypothetical protein
MTDTDKRLMQLRGAEMQIKAQLFDLTEQLRNVRTTIAVLESTAQQDEPQDDGESLEADADV